MGDRAPFAEDKNNVQTGQQWIHSSQLSCQFMLWWHPEICHLSSPFLKSLLGRKPSPGFHFPSNETNRRSFSFYSMTSCHCCHPPHSQALHVAAWDDPLLLLLCQAELPEERWQFEFCSAGPGGSTERVTTWDSVTHATKCIAAELRC